MSVLDRRELEASPLADLHTIAAELGIDDFRRLKREELVETILVRGGGDVSAPPAEETAESDDEEPAPARPRRRRGVRRGGRARAASDDDAEAEAEDEPAPTPEPAAADRVVEGTVELLATGAGFVRSSPPEPSDDDAYISAAQVRRCELVAGDVVTGPVRARRRSERYPSLAHVETINGASAESVADAPRYEDLPCAFASRRLALGAADPALAEIDSLAPFGLGSRVTIAGPARAGKSALVRRVAAALAAQEGLRVEVVLAGVRPEELADWREGPATPKVALSFAASAETRASALDGAVEQARRVAARGDDAVLLVDTLDGIDPSAARRAIAAARDLVDGGSLTIVATAGAPLGGETTVIALTPAGADGGYALDPAASGTLRADLLTS